uniref:hypothetical protein n=1 Tax=Phocaeicola vulgatus TaxID=821 RepID=UPI0040298E69
LFAAKIEISIMSQFLTAYPFSYTHGGKHHGVSALSFPFFHILSFFPSYKKIRLWKKRSCARFI